MLSADAVKAGRAVLEDSMHGLLDKVQLASDAIQAKPGYRQLLADADALFKRIVVGIAAWNQVSPVFGLPRYVWNSDLCMQQLEQWGAELQNLWTRWAELSGQSPVAIAKPRERIAKLRLGLGGALSGGADFVWSLVAMGVLGLVGWYFWRRWK